MMKIVAGLLLLMLAMLGAIVGLSIAVAEGTKETKTNSAGVGLVAGTNTPAGTAVSTDSAGLGSMLTMPLQNAASLRDARLILPATDCKNRNAADGEGLGGEFYYHVTYVGKESCPNAICPIHVGLEGGGLLKIETSTTGKLTRPCSQFKSGECIKCGPVGAETTEELPVTFDATQSRRLHQHTLGRRAQTQQFGGGFGAALLTSGSFTMMAAGSGF